MNQEKNLISLKEAAKISGYSADYIGQLIRSGKIPGKQVYTGIAWMTTAEAVTSYKNKENSKTDNNSAKDIYGKFQQRFNIELQVLKLFFAFLKNNKTVYWLLGSIIILLILIIFFGNQAFNKSSLPDQPSSVEQMTY